MTSDGPVPTNKDRWADESARVVFISKLNGLNMHDTMTNVKEFVRNTRVYELKKVIVNLNGKFSTEEHAVVKKWMEKDGCSIHELFNMEVLLSALDSRETDLANDLTFFKPLKE